MILLAHHVELQHLPVLAAFLALGVGFGWRATSRLLAWTPERQGASGKKS